jgi:hypothetical protein
MKNLLFLFCFFTHVISAQENCQGSFTEYYLNSNNIRASFFPRGNKFTDGNNGAFLAPYPSGGKLSTIFASSPWLGGYDDAGNLRLVAETYPTQVSVDFSVGPLNYIGLPHDSICANFDRAWSVNFEDILLHQADFISDGKIDDTIPSIFGWPALGNTNFEKYSGFALPEDHSPQGWAEFEDLNFNNQYEPESGEYPTVRLNGYEFVPDQILWMVFNDVDPGDTIAPWQMRFEFQLTAFAFHCQDNDVLNNTIFNNYKIINRNVIPLDSIFFGLWTDYDLGCSEDDFMGSDSARHTEFVYNADMVDGDSEGDCTTGDATYGAKPPVQSMTWLSHPMHSFMAFNRMHEIPIDVYRNLNGLWGDGTPMRPHGDGYHQDSSLMTTKFLHHGDPRDTNSWAAVNILDEGLDVRSVSSISLGRLDPGAVAQVLAAYMFHYSPDLGHLEQIAFMQQNIDSIFNMLPKVDQYCSTFLICAQKDCVWPGDFDHNGIADHRDYLMWGVFNGQSGPKRDGLISWRGHPGEDWSEEFVEINAKHGDADGNGIVNEEDIDIHSQNLFLTNRFYTGENQYPIGSDILVTAEPFIDAQGSVKRLNVKTNRPVENLLGLTFEIEFDTSLFEISRLNSYQGDTTRLYFDEEFNPNVFKKFAFTKRNHLPVSMDSASYFFIPFSFNGLRLKSGLPIPDSTILRLRNLKAIDPDGNDLLLGSEPLVVYRDGFVGIEYPTSPKTSVYPNPTDGFIHIEIEKETEAQLYSIQGHLLKVFTVSDLKGPVDVSDLPPGIYILRISASGETLKLVIGS